MKEYTTTKNPGWRNVLFLLFCAPLIFYAVYYLFIHPSRNYYIDDAEVAYFLSSLGIFKGIPYSYIDHPGTPLAVLGTIILGVTYPFHVNAPEGFIKYYLQNPWVFLDIAHLLVAAAHLGAAWMLFSYINKSSKFPGVVVAMSISLLYFAVHPFSLPGTLIWDHNSLSFPIGIPILIYLSASLQKENGPNFKSLILLGVGAGAMATITIYMLVWMVGIMATLIIYFFLKNESLQSAIKSLLLIGAAGITGFFIAVIPIINKLGRFWYWILSILSHKSNYLAEPENQPLMQRIVSNFHDLYDLLPVLVISGTLLICLAIVAIMLKWKNRTKAQFADIAFLLGLIVQIVVLTLIFLDHQIRPYYFLSVASILPMLALITLRLFTSQPQIYLILNRTIPIFVIGGLIFMTKAGVAYKEYEINSLKIAQDITSQSIANYAKLTHRPPQKLSILWMYGTYSICWRLWHDNARNVNAFTPELSSQCHNQYDLTGRVWVPNGKIPLEEFNWDIIFTCEKLIDNIMAKEQTFTVESHPELEWGCGKMAILYNQ